MKTGIIFRIILLGLFLAANNANADVEEKIQGNRIGIFGDSLGDGVWIGLYNTMKQHPHDKLFRYSKVGSGVTSPGFMHDVKELPGQIAKDKITEAVVMFGANDQQGLRDENHKGHNFKTAEWKTAYEARIDAMLAEFEQAKVPVIWLGLPVMRKKDMNEGAEYINAILAEKIKSHNAVFVPLIDDFKNADHEFSLRLTDAKGKGHLVRADDGIHFTPYGYEMIANKVYQALLDSQAARTPAALPAANIPPDATPLKSPALPPAPPLSAAPIATPATAPAPVNAPQR